MAAGLCELKHNAIRIKGMTFRNCNAVKRSQVKIAKILIGGQLYGDLSLAFKNTHAERRWSVLHPPLKGVLLRFQEGNHGLFDEECR